MSGIDKTATDEVQSTGSLTSKQLGLSLGLGRELRVSDGERKNERTLIFWEALLLGFRGFYGFSGFENPTPQPMDVARTLRSISRNVRSSEEPARTLFDSLIKRSRGLVCTLELRASSSPPFAINVQVNPLHDLAPYCFPGDVKVKSVEQFDVPRHTARIDFHDKVC